MHIDFLFLAKRLCRYTFSIFGKMSMHIHFVYIYIYSYICKMFMQIHCFLFLAKHPCIPLHHHVHRQNVHMFFFGKTFVQIQLFLLLAKRLCIYTPRYAQAESLGLSDVTTQEACNDLYKMYKILKMDTQAAFFRDHPMRYLSGLRFLDVKVRS